VTRSNRAGPGATGRPSRILLPAVCASLLAAAGALAVAARLAWYDAVVSAPGRAPVPVTVTGEALVPGLDGVALLASAAVAAAVALSGVARRLLGGVLVLAAVGLGAGWVSAGPPTPTEIAALPGAPAGAQPPSAVRSGAGPAVATGGLLLLVAAGVVLAGGEARLPRLAARYAGAPSRRAEPDPQRAAWDTLDAGGDPTAD